MGALLDEKGKLRLSLGLFAPDTITSLGKTAKTTTRMKTSSLQVTKEIQRLQKPADKEWYGIAI